MLFSMPDIFSIRLVVREIEYNSSLVIIKTLED